jgi:hypothetical protein
MLKTLQSRMNYIFINLVFIFSSSFEPLDGTAPISLVVSYSAISCSCAQWRLETNDKKKSGERIYLERSSEKLPDAGKLWDGTTLPVRFRVTGNFSSGRAVPENFLHTKGAPEPARIFRYTSIVKLK